MPSCTTHLKTHSLPISASYVTYEHKQQKKAFVTEKRRIKGTFLETLELMDFPFDIQVCC